MSQPAYIGNAINVAEAVASLLMPFGEVIVHDLKTETIVHIANNFSQRDLGDPSNLSDLDFDPQSAVIGPYEKLNWNGRRIKSISSVVRDQNEHPVALICINVDLSQFDQAKQVLDMFMAVPKAETKPSNLFNEDWHEQINQFIKDWTSENTTSIDRLSRTQKRDLVLALEEKNAFSAKHSVNYIARVLNLGRATIYNYLKEK